MAKEMMIVFVYDTARCCKEEDDPAEAVLYFHPAWVSLTQRLALAGQLMGVHHFLSTSFAAPRSITLQSGKFVLKRFGQYVLAVGTDRNIQDWILERRADTLESLLRFFHCDLARILESLNNDRNKFAEKLYQMFETYLPILQYSANLFSNIPVMRLPKSASNIFLEALQVLQHFQETNGILSGALFYNNKVVVTQLGADLTKQIVITDPYRIKAPAERIPTEFHLPIGVQLLQVYIEREQLAKLVQVASNERYYYTCVDAATKRTPQRKSIGPQKGSGVKEPPVSCTMSGMKRDTSRIFTVPEEGEEGEPASSSMSQYYVSSVPLAIHDLPPPTRTKQQETKVTERVVKATTAAVNPLTPSVCATPLKDVNRVLHDTALLICSASDETGDEERKENDRKKSTSSNENYRDGNDDIPDVVKEALRCKRLNKLKNAISKGKLMKKKKSDRKSVSLPDLTSSDDPLKDSGSKLCRSELNETPSKFIESPSVDRNSDSLRRKSIAGSSDKRQSRTITDPCYPVFRCDGLPVSQSLYEQYVTSSYNYELRNDGSGDSGVHECRDDQLRDDHPPKDLSNDETMKSATDNGSTTRNVTHDAYMAQGECSYRPSRVQYQSRINRGLMRLPLKPVSLTSYEGKDQDSCSGSWNLPQRHKDGLLDGLQLTPLMSKLSLLADEQRCSKGLYRDSTPSEIPSESTCASSAAVAPATVALVATNYLTGERQSEHQTTTSAAATTMATSTIAVSAEATSTTKSVMVKSVATTIMTATAMSTTTVATSTTMPTVPTATTSTAKLINTETSDSENDTNNHSTTSAARDGGKDGEREPPCLIQTELFICGYQNMVLILLMENGTANNPELIHTLWQTCVDILGKLETRLQQCLEPLPSSDSSKELYSILSIDPQWDTIQRTGLWGVAELEVVSSLHDRFQRSRRNLRDARYLTDITVRTEDTVVYGNQCGRIEVFYQQAVSPSSSFGALPTPADPMGIVALKAKRRLERDHGIVLL